MLQNFLSKKEKLLKNNPLDHKENQKSEKRFSGKRLMTMPPLQAYKLFKGEHRNMICFKSFLTDETKKHYTISLVCVFTAPMSTEF